MTDIKPAGGEHIPAIEIYKQQYAHFGRMNDLIYKLPTLIRLSSVHFGSSRTPRKRSR